MASNRMRHPIKMPAAVLKTTRPKLFRRASITSWGKNDLRMTRVAADVNLKEFMLTVQQQKVMLGHFTVLKLLTLHSKIVPRDGTLLSLR